MKKTLGKEKANAKLNCSTFAKTRKRSARDNGITLIALIVTIIVLLILAGVTINLAIKDNGIFKRAANAATAYNNAEQKEDQAMKNAADEMDKYSKQYGLDSGSSTTGGRESGSGTGEGDGTGTTITASGDTGKTFIIGGTEDAPTITIKESSDSTPIPTTIEVKEGGNLQDPSTYTDTTKTALSKVYGTEVSYTSNDGTSVGGKTWRVFFIDFGNKYKDGYGTVYLKADWTSNNIDDSNTSKMLSYYNSYNPSDENKSETSILANMNQKWYIKRGKTTWNPNEYATSWLCDPTQWIKYKNSKANYVIGSPSAEMYCDSYNSVNHTKVKYIFKAEYSENHVPGYYYTIDGVPAASAGTGATNDWWTGRNTVESTYNSMYLRC